MRTLLAKRGWRAREPSAKTNKAHSTARARRCQGNGRHRCTSRTIRHREPAVQWPAMKNRFRLGVVLVTLALHLLAPLAAYASPTPGPGFDDFCSASRNATALPGSVPALPIPYSPKHGLSHCSLCSGSASAALLPGGLSLAAPLAHAEASLPRAARALVTVTAVLLPPSRGPPTVS